MHFMIILLSLMDGAISAYYANMHKYTQKGVYFILSNV